MFPKNLTLIASLTERRDRKKPSLILYGYEIGAIHCSAWQTLVVSPIIYGTIKEAQEASDKAIQAANKAINKRKLVNSLKTQKVFSSPAGGGDAS